MDLNKLIKYVRGSCVIQDPSKGVENDPYFLEMTDEEITDILEVMLTGINPNSSIRNVQQKDIFPLLLLTKREIYSRLSVKEAPNVNLKSGQDSISQSDRFEHYLSLIKEVSKQYDEYVATGKEIVVAEVFLSNRYHTQRYYNMAEPPNVNLNVDSVQSDSLNLSWDLDMNNRSKFLEYNLYYKKGSTLLYDEYSKKMDSTATKIIFNDIHHMKYKLEGLVSNTEYSICLIVKELNGLYGISQQIVKTGGELIG